VITPIPPKSDAGLLCGDAGRVPVTKIDLLFMIDNSSSMADKEDILAQAVPDLVNRLIDPVCVDSVTLLPVGQRRPDGSCAEGIPEFDPIKDIHIGIITSSLGNHGASGGICDDAFDQQSLRSYPHNNDKAHLVARAEMDLPVPTFQTKAFLNWNPAPGSGGAAMPGDIIGPFQSMVTGVGQHGCGYEASLEAIYRFLIDPEPYDAITVDTVKNPPIGIAALVGTDMALLQQRADFLRPDSLVAVIAVTDENDCSIVDVDGGQGFYAIIPASGIPATSILSHGTTPCLTNPNDKCCINCGQPAVAGCPDPASDTECQKGAWMASEDPANLRCWQQKRRYGFDFLYPVKRYIDGLLNDQVPDRKGAPVKNPLYSDLACKGGMGCAPPRGKDLVFFAGIVGVPWRAFAVDSRDLTKGYLSAKQMAEGHVWEKILGDPDNPAGPVPPTDPHMIESIAPRPGLPGPASAPTADESNGHEWDPSQDAPPNADLQYACVFDLTPSKLCATAADCDCAGPTARNNPLCQDLLTGGYSSMQTRAKGYPGLRQLQVLQGLGEQGIVGSICPANTLDKSRADFGYRPAISAIVNRLRNPLRGCVIVK